MNNQQYVQDMEDLIVDLLDGRSDSDLHFGEGFSKEDAEKAIALKNKCLKNQEER